MICTKSYLTRLHSRYQISNNTIPYNSMSESFIVIVPNTEKHITFECSKQLITKETNLGLQVIVLFKIVYQYI